MPGTEGGSAISTLKIDPAAVRALERNERKDWRPVAARVEADQGRWHLVWIQADGRRGIAREIRERLRAGGCAAQVVGLVGLGELPRPWHGIAVFARVPGPFLGL